MVVTDSGKVGVDHGQPEVTPDSGLGDDGVADGHVGVLDVAETSTTAVTPPDELTEQPKKAAAQAGTTTTRWAGAMTALRRLSVRVPRLRERRMTLPLLALALTVAAACVVVFGVRAHHVYSVDTPIASARDSATKAAGQAMLNVTTIDSKNLAAFDARLRSSFAGDALEQVRRETTTSLAPRIQQAGDKAGSTTSELLGASPVQVDAKGGKVQVLVYMAVRGVDPQGKPGDPNTMGFLVDMTKSGATWKATKVTSLDGVDFGGDSASAAQGGN